MDERSSFRNKWLYIVVWMLILIISYLLITSRIEGFWSDPRNIIRDAAVFFFFLFLWMAFFAQFVLPVRTFVHRQKIFDRLFRHLTGSHGPALFIENGEIIQHSREALKGGPGVVWLDSASAAITRTSTAIRRIVGPGVHFTDGNEYIEQSCTLDLHIQFQKLGPKDGEDPFDAMKEGQSKERFDDIQSRRKRVSALSRDGIELVPDISVAFRVNTRFPANNAPGSRFGFRTGTTREAKDLEREDQEIVRRALLGEGINPFIDPESALHRVAWNRLPAMLAVDIWRDYAAKFRLDELFDETQEGPASPSPQGNPPAPGDDEQPNHPGPAAPDQGRNDSFFVRFLQSINDSMERIIVFLERRLSQRSNRPPAPPAPPPPSPTPAPSKRTSLKVINEMLMARLTQQFVDELDEYGKRTGRQVPSEEYKLLQIRGLKVLSASASNVRLHPAVQEALIKSWTANWLKLAKDESDQLDLRRNLIEAAAQERAQCEYAKLISREIFNTCENGNRTEKDLLRSVLFRLRALIRSGEHSSSLRIQMNSELQDIEDMLKWLGDTP